MHIQDIFGEHKTTFSFEFFPPNSIKPRRTCSPTSRGSRNCGCRSSRSLARGPAARHRERTPDLVLASTAKPRADGQTSHLTSASVTRTRNCRRFWTATPLLRGSRTSLPLGGDPPRDRPNYDRAADAFLPRRGAWSVSIRSLAGRRCPRGFGIGVAGFPEGHPAHAQPPQGDAPSGSRKVDAGADYICGPLFFDNRDFYDFREPLRVGRHSRADPRRASCRSSRRQGMKSAWPSPSAGGGGSRRCCVRSAAAGTTRRWARVGVHWATEQCRALLDNACAASTSTRSTNRTRPARFTRNLGVTDSVALCV